MLGYQLAPYWGSEWGSWKDGLWAVLREAHGMVELFTETATNARHTRQLVPFCSVKMMSRLLDCCLAGVVMRIKSREGV